jgi:hypothetical protein
MASCNNSSPALALVTLPNKRKNYDVFVTFRGEDTRYNFTDFLINVLEDKGVSFFFLKRQIILITLKPAQDVPLRKGTNTAKRKEDEPPGQNTSAGLAPHTPKQKN